MYEAKTTVSVRVPVELNDSIVKLAKASHTTLSGVACMLLELGLAAHSTPTPVTHDAPEGWGGPVSVFLPRHDLAGLQILAQDGNVSLSHLLWELIKTGMEVSFEEEEVSALTNE